MLVFAVLRDRSGLTANQGSILVVHRIEHQLLRGCATKPCMRAHSKTACVSLLATAVVDAACCRR